MILTLNKRLHREELEERLSYPQVSKLANYTNERECFQQEERGDRKAPNF